MKSAPVQSSASLASSRVMRDMFGKKLSFCSIILFLCINSFSQDSTVRLPATKIYDTDTKIDTQSVSLPQLPKIIHRIYPSEKRTWLVTGVHLVGYTSALIILNNTWYKNYAHTSFHTFNDSREWQQVDKVGHGWTAYSTGLASAAAWRWAGQSPKRSAVLGGLSGIAYLTAIEFLDAHSSKWGWSWSDIGANFIGSGFFISQELLWQKQRIRFKFSFHHKDYNEGLLNARADDLFGKAWYERMLKDYNAQTYWFSANLRSFFPRLPGWLNAAVGYGADGMFGGFENKWTDKDGNTITRFDIPRKRQFYLAPDIDFTKIKTNKKWLRTAFFCLDAFKCPAPALMLDSKGRWKAYAVYF